MIKKIKNCILLAGPAFLALLSNLPANSESEIIVYIIQQKFPISLTITTITLIPQILDIIFSKEEKVIKNWAKQFLRFIAKEELGGGEYQTRISILRPEKGWEFILKYIYFVLVKDFFNNFKNKTWGKSFKNIPFRLFSNYLTIYARYSYPNEEKSYTHFLISSKDKGSNGIADKCYKEGREIEVQTCNISEFKLPLCYTEVKNSRTSQAKYIKKYMDETFIDESNYDSLLKMNTKANNLYALAITNNEENIWGVLVIDNVSNNPRSFKTELDTAIDKYAKIFCFTLSTVR